MNATLNSQPAARALRAAAQLLELAVDLGRRRLGAGTVGASQLCLSRSPAPQLDPPESPVPVLHLAPRKTEDADHSVGVGFSHYCTLFLGLCTLVGAFPVTGHAADVIAESHFDADAEGWMLHAGGKIPRGVVYQPLGGLSGGGITTDHGQNTGWFAAPASFLGDQRAAYGGKLRFVFKQSKSSGAVLGYTVQLDSSGLSLGRYIGEQPPRTFVAFEFVLDENSGWFNRGTGNLATRAEVFSVLSNLQFLHIRADYTYASDDVNWLDDVVLEGPPEPKLRLTENPVRLEPGQVLTLQGSPGASYDIQFSPRLEEDSRWQPMLGVTLPNVPSPKLEISIYDVTASGPNQFLRAVHRP